jgi:YbbR domain-containing protein
MKKWFLNNLGLKILALCLAAMLWLFVNAELTSKYKLVRKSVDHIKISILRQGQKMVIGDYDVSLDPEFIDLMIEGPKDNIEVLTPENIIAFVDITNIKETGNYFLPVKVILPNYLRLVFKAPDCKVKVVSRQNQE